MSEPRIKSEWRSQRFDQMAISVTDRVDDPASAGVDRYVGLEHLDSESLKISRWGVPTDVEATKLRFRRGDIIFGRRRAYQRKLAIADFDGICSAHAMVLRARPEVVLPDFLSFFMQSDVFMKRAQEISVGSLSPTINWKALACEQFVLPRLDEQRRISALLSASHGAAHAAEALVQRGEALQRSFVMEAVNRASERYPVVVAQSLFSIITVGIVVKPADLYVTRGSGVIALRSLNVTPGRISLEDVVEISHAGHEQHQKSRLRTGDLVIVRTGRPGDAAVVTDELDGANCVDLIVARPSDRLVARYAEAVLNSEFGRRQFTAGSAGTAQQHFNVGAFKVFRMPVPPRQVQEEFVAEYDAMNGALLAVRERRLESSRLHRELVNAVMQPQSVGV